MSDSLRLTPTFDSPASVGGRIGLPPLSRWAVITLAAAGSFFLTTSLLSYRNQLRVAESEGLAAASIKIIAETNELIALIQAAETAQRGYLFAEDTWFLDSYEETLAKVPGRLAELRRLVRSPEHGDALDHLERAALARVEHLRRTLRLYREQGKPAALAEVRSRQGQAFMEDFRKQAVDFRRQETNLWRTRNADAARMLRFTHMCDFLTAATGLGLAALAFWRLRREFLQRHAIAENLAAQRELLHVTVHSLGEAVVTTDPEGRVRSLNAVAERLIARPNAEAVGQPLTDVIRLVHEQTRDSIESPALRALREGRSVRQVNQALLIAWDGTERRIDETASPICTADGRVLGAVLVFRDVTERKRAVDALRRSEERLRRALAAARIVAWEVDIPAGVMIRSENASELFGLGAFGTVAEYLAVVQPADRTRVEAAFGAALAGESDGYAVEFRVITPDGRHLWIADRGELRRDVQGRPTHLVGVGLDVTDRKRADEELREGDRRKDRFLATLAHELRNPLAPISNALAAWPFVRDDPDEMDRLRDTMDRQVTQITRLIDDLLDISRISRGKITLKSERLELKTVVDAAAEGVRPLVEARGHRLSLHVPDPSPVIVGDVARLVQVFSNLMHNAAKYSEDGGRIEVRVRMRTADGGGNGDVAPGSAIVSIRDEGPGIPAEMLTRVFDIFTQVDETLDRSHGGLGIGLTLVKTLVELHGGTVTAESDGPGTGCTFAVTLPLAASDEAPAHDEPASSPESAALPSYRVLVVDDMRPSARTLGLMLEGIGQEVRTANDGPTALATLEEFDADVVLLDIAMPGMDGYEVARRIRDRPADPSGRRPLLVALTGYGREEDRQQAFDAGFDRHLVKPTSLDDLKGLLAGIGGLAGRTAEVGR